MPNPNDLPRPEGEPHARFVLTLFPPYEGFMPPDKTRSYRLRPEIDCIATSGRAAAWGRSKMSGISANGKYCMLRPAAGQFDVQWIPVGDLGAADGLAELLRQLDVLRRTERAGSPAMRKIISGLSLTVLALAAYCMSGPGCPDGRRQEQTVPTKKSPQDMQRQKEEEQRGREWEQGQRIINDVLRGETFRLLGIKHGLQGLALDFQRDYLLHGPIGDPFGVDPDMPPFQRDMIDALISSGNRFAEEHARKICNEWNDRVREMMKKHKEKQAVDQEVSVSSAKPVTEPDPIKNMFSIVEDFDKLVAEGRELHRQKNYGEAIAKYKEALKLYNNDYKQVHDPKAAIALIAAYKAKGGLKGKMAAIVVDLKWKLEDERRKREEP